MEPDGRPGVGKRVAKEVVRPTARQAELGKETSGGGRETINGTGAGTGTGTGTSTKT